MTLRGYRNGWYIIETAHVHWPGALPWRGRTAAEQGRGYATEDAAIDRARTINAHYNAKFGRGLPLAVLHLDGLHHRAAGRFHHRR